MTDRLSTVVEHSKTVRCVWPPEHTAYRQAELIKELANDLALLLSVEPWGYDDPEEGVSVCRFCNANEHFGPDGGKHSADCVWQQAKDHWS